MAQTLRQSMPTRSAPGAALPQAVPNNCLLTRDGSNDGHRCSLLLSRKIIGQGFEEKACEIMERGKPSNRYTLHCQWH